MKRTTIAALAGALARLLRILAIVLAIAGAAALTWHVVVDDPGDPVLLKRAN